MKKDKSMDIFVTGNTSFLSLNNVKKAFPNDTVIICGEDSEDEKLGKVRSFSFGIMNPKSKKLFQAYDFKRVIYISEYLTLEGKAKDEVEILKKLFSRLVHFNIKEFVFLTSSMVLSNDETGTNIILKSEEELCTHYTERYGMVYKQIRCPFLVYRGSKKDYFQRMFDKLEKDEEWKFLSTREERLNLIMPADLTEFMYRLSDSWTDASEQIDLRPKKSITFGELADRIREYYPNAKLNFAEGKPHSKEVYGEDTARIKFNWKAERDPAEYIDDFHDYFKGNLEPAKSLYQRIREKFHINKTVTTIIELIFGAILVELYEHFAGGNSVQFRMIDIRLLYIVVMSTVYGPNIGFVAAVFEIVSLIFAFMSQGITLTLLFYAPTNWVPFILYFAVAAICGYHKQKGEEDIVFLRRENKELRNQNEFLRVMYEEVQEYKNQYKRDLIGSRDGFGRIFDVVKKLSTTEPEKIFAESIPVMEDVLDSKSIALYTINNKNARFARLVVASQSIGDKLNKSIKLDEYKEALDMVEMGEVWFNSDLNTDMPSFIAGINSEEGISVLILIYNAEFRQASNYYMNLIRVLAGLMENFIVKAWDYQKLQLQEIYVTDTMFVKEDYFRKQLEIRKEMVENRLTSIRLFEIDADKRSPYEISSALEKAIRTNDFACITESGKIYVLVSQVDEDSEGIILDRLTKIGLNARVVEEME